MQNLESKASPSVGKIIEAVFCIGYLVFDLIAAIIFFVNAHSNHTLILFGFLTLLLGSGDAFHLIPRVLEAFGKNNSKINWWMGLGLEISSITMTVFYVLLYYIWKSLFPQITCPVIFPVLIWSTAILRIILCLCPQNNWFSPQGNPKWSIYRNVPFAITGLCLILLFILSGNTYGYGLWQMSIAITVSFLCYFPVVLYSKKKPIVGMLMIPKTIAYIYMISLGLSLIGKL